MKDNEVSKVNDANKASKSGKESKASSVRGKAGEDAVCEYLKRQGHGIVKRNYRIKCGEIDIISEKDNYIIFTEVKTRKFGAAVKGFEAMTKAKKRRIITTSEWFIIGNPKYKNFSRRFDTAYVTVTTEKIPQILEIEYYKGDFTAIDLE